MTGSEKKLGKKRIFFVFGFRTFCILRRISGLAHCTVCLIFVYVQYFVLEKCCLVWLS